MTKPCMILVSTLLDDGVTVEQEKEIDHSDYYDRKWLAKHCWWALRNDRVVMTKPI